MSRSAALCHPNAKCSKPQVGSKERAIAVLVLAKGMFRSSNAALAHGLTKWERSQFSTCAKHHGQETPHT